MKGYGRYRHYVLLYNNIQLTTISVSYVVLKYNQWAATPIQFLPISQHCSHDHLTIISISQHPLPRRFVTLVVTLFRGVRTFLIIFVGRDNLNENTVLSLALTNSGGIFVER